MQKTGLATLIGSLSILPLDAKSDTTFYGFISGGIESNKASGGQAPGYASRTRVVDHVSRLGFKGREDLGNGNSALWQLESGLRHFEQGGVDDRGQNAAFATRNSFIGLEHAAIGRILLGHHDSAYKMFTGSGNPTLGTALMPNATANQFGPNAVNSRGEARLNNSLHYYSPNWNGFKLGATWAMDETRQGGGNAKRLSLGLGYVWRGLTLAAAWDRRYDTAIAPAGNTPPSAVAGKSLSYHSLAASYRFDTGTLIGGNYEWGRLDPPGGERLRQDDWLIALSQPFGAAELKLSYGQLGALKQLGAGTDGKDFRASQWLLGGGYRLSKTTQAFAYYTRIRNHAKASANFSVNPLYDQALGTPKASLSAGSDPQAMGLGLSIVF